MATKDLSAERVEELRQLYVTKSVATPPIVVGKASGARIEAADGNSYIDFAGGIGCLNFGHNHPDVVAAIHAQADQYLHQCFMVAMYEPYVEVCKRLAELSPCVGEDQKSILLNSGAEAVENAVKIARAATGRPSIVVFDRAFHGRTLMTMTMTQKVNPYKKGFGPFAPEVYRTTAPYPYRGISAQDALADFRQLLKADVDPQSVAAVVLEPVQGEGGFIPAGEEFLTGLVEICREHGILYIDDEVQAGMGRTGPVWAVENWGIQPDLLVSGKSLGAGMPLAAVTGRAEIMDAPVVGGLGGTFGGNPLSCAAAIPALDIVSTPDFRQKTDRLAEKLRSRLEDIASRVDVVGEVRGLGPMLAMEIVSDKASKTPSKEIAALTSANARDRGLMLLTCGLDGNIVRILVPNLIEDEDLERGLNILEESLVAAAG